MERIASAGLGINADVLSRRPVEGARGAPSSSSFADALGKAVAQVDQLQASADRSATEVALGGGNLHETALALEKADVALKVAVKVRNKLVEAYQEVMRMSI
jgi:flagellar hook-basal body complex protein FliE